MISCTEVLAELSDYLDDGLTAEFRRLLEAHLSHCRSCEVIYDSMRKSMKIVTETGSFDLPESVAERLLAKIRASLQLFSDQGGNEER